MSQNRRDALAALATLIGAITEVKTVRRVSMPIDITQWAESELPLVEIREPDESAASELTNMRQLTSLNIVLRVWFVIWGEVPTTTYETLEKKIRNKIGDNFKLNDTVNGVWVTNISKVDGEMPLYHFDIILRLKLYLELQNA